MIGKPGEPISRISQAHADRGEVRGRELTGDLMGRVSFRETSPLRRTGDEPREEQRYFLDLLLVAIAEHGMMPTNVAARMTLAAAPASLHGAVAAGILGAGPVILGTAEECARLLTELHATGTDPERAAHDIRATGARVAGCAPPGPKAAGPAGRADPRAGRRAERQQGARRARPQPPRRRRRRVRAAA